MPQDHAQAAYWNYLAANQGDALAQYNLGVMFNEGKGVIQDDAEALRWQRMSAEQGYVNAQFNLGLMFSRGVGVIRDDTEAAHWFRLAAEQGHALAQRILGVMYYEGKGVPEKNIVQAYAWLTLAAAAQAEGGAVKFRDGISDVMTAAQIAEAEALALEYQEAYD